MASARKEKRKARGGGQLAAVRLRLQIFLLVLVVVMVVGVAGFMLIEKLSFLNAVYFTTTTIATVGFGDIHAVTAAGKVLVIIVIVVGVGTFVGFVGNAAEYFIVLRDTKSRQEKVDIMIGVFFSEVGRALLLDFSRADPERDLLECELAVQAGWAESDFKRVGVELGKYHYRVDYDRLDLELLRELLAAHREFMVRLLENPNLIEHETFTDLLRAVFHLADELQFRPDFGTLPANDKAHLVGDVRRAYSLLVSEWLEQMQYLETNYPYLFSLAVRTNPFSEAASAVVE